MGDASHRMSCGPSKGGSHRKEGCMGLTIFELVFLVLTYVAVGLGGVYVGSRLTEEHIMRYFKEEQK